MSFDLRDRVLALAGVFQAVKLVDDTAFRGLQELDAAQATLESVFKLDAADTADVYGGVTRLATGLRTLVRILDARIGESEMLLMRYAIGLMHLARQAEGNADLISRLRQGLERTADQARYFGALHDNVLASLADLYVQTIGTLVPRLLINGEPARLQTPRNVNLIRALLLGGVRSAVLWRQTGGSRWSLLFARGRLRREAERLLEELGHPAPG